MVLVKMTTQEALHWLVWHIACIFVLHHVISVGLVQSQACCDVKMMDASQQAAIDTGRPLTSGSYAGLSVRFCTTDKINIQIWNMIDGSNVQLKWQTTFTPTKSQSQQQQRVTIDLSLSPISIGDNDRLGLYSQLSGSTTTKIAIPYGMDALFGNMQFTQTRFSNSSALAVGLQTALVGSSAQLKRTFANFVRLCVKSDCSDQPADPAPSTSETATLPNCACPASCSPDAAFTDYTAQYETLAQYLGDLMSAASDSIHNVMTKSVNTSTCPNGTVPGPYGTGSCYIVVQKMYAQNSATMYCQVYWRTSKLVDIYSEPEEIFVSELVSNYTRTAGMAFWSSGMYDTAMNQYIWGQTDTTKANVMMMEMGYMNFLGNNPGTPPDGKACVLLSADPVTNKLMWMPADCYEPSWFICKIPRENCY